MLIHSRHKLKALLSFLILSNLFLASASLAHAADPAPTAGGGTVQQSITKLLCTPSDPTNAAGTTGTGASDIYTCINRGYQFIVVLGSIGAVFWIVLAGYLYMASDGSQESITKAKEILVSTVAGMFIILMTYVFLRQLNPSIVHFPAIDMQLITNAPPLLSPKANCLLVHTKDPSFCDGYSDVTPGTGNAGSGPTGMITGKGGAVCNAGKDTRTTEHAKCSIRADFQQAITEASSKYGIEENFIKAIIQQESHWDETTTSGQAWGLIQMIEATAARMGCTGSAWKTNGVLSIPCGVKYLAEVRDKGHVNDRRNIGAGYNKGWGPSTLGPSANCPGWHNWECPFANPEQNKCTDNLEEARNYVVSLERFYQEYGKCGK